MGPDTAGVNQADLDLISGVNITLRGGSENVTYHGLCSLTGQRCRFDVGLKIRKLADNANDNGDSNTK